MVGEDFMDTIKRDLPILHNALNPISKMHLIHKLQKLTIHAQIRGWEEFGKNRRKELRNLEKTIVFNQIIKNNFLHAWKQIYKDVNEFCNEYIIPNENRNFKLQ